jgi:hypothetical protein
VLESYRNKYLCTGRGETVYNEKKDKAIPVTGHEGP